MVISPESSLSVCNVTQFGDMPANDNAQLIAAAPDLLKVCQKYQEMFHSPDWECTEMMDEMAKLTRAAIAKATD